jgi:hypothetical protein
MKLRIKAILSFAAATLLSQAVFALETGGLLTNDSKFANAEKNGSLKLDQKNGVNLWFRNPVSKDGNCYIAGEGAFQTEYDATVADSDKKLKLYADLNLLKLNVKKELESGDITFAAGRFYNSDLSGLVFTQNADGLKLDASLSRFEISLYGAYTGLLNAKNITIIGDTTDLNDKEKKVYVVANKFMVGGLTISLPYIFASQTISVEGFGTFSLESKKLNRFYGTFALNGPIVSPVFYNVSSTIGFFKYDNEDMTKGNLTRASISVYPDFKSMSISLNGLYASGKQGPFKAFQGFTKGTAVNSLLEPGYSALLTTGLSATIKPVSNLLLYANGDVVFDAQAGTEKEEIKQAGFQYGVGFNYQVMSDVSLGVGFTQYTGKEEYEGTIGAKKTQLRINAAIAF